MKYQQKYHTVILENQKRNGQIKHISSERKRITMEFNCVSRVADIERMHERRIKIEKNNSRQKRKITN